LPTTGGNGAPARNSADDSTPFEEYAAMNFAGTIETYKTLAAGFDDSACRMICEGDPNCGAYVITNAGACHWGISGKYTVTNDSTAVMYKKMYRVLRLSRGMSLSYAPTLKLKSAHDGLCLENPGGNAQATTYECDQHQNRRWTLPTSTVYDRGSVMQIKNHQDSGDECLEDANSSPGTAVNLNPCVGTTDPSGYSQVIYSFNPMF